MCVYTSVTMSNKYHRLSLPEGMGQTLKCCYDKESPGTVGLLLTWLSVEGFSSFCEQREGMRSGLSGSVYLEQGVQSMKVFVHTGCHRDTETLLIFGKTRVAA